MSEFESERLCVGGPYDGQSFMFRNDQAAWPIVTEDTKAAWYRSDPADPTRVDYAGPEFNGMSAQEFGEAEEMAPWLEEQEHDGE